MSHQERSAPNTYETGRVPQEEWNRLAATDVINGSANSWTQSLIGVLNPNQIVLDVGAGSNSGVRDHLHREGGMYVGLDINQEALLAQQQTDSVFVVQANIREGLPIADESIHVVHGRYVLAFLDAETRRRTVTEMYRVLKPGGRLILTDYDWSVVDGSENVQMLRDIGLGISLFDADYGQGSREEIANFLPESVPIHTTALEFPLLADYTPLLALRHVIPQGLRQEEHGERLAAEAKELFARLAEEAGMPERPPYRWPNAVAVLAEKPVSASPRV